VSLRTSLDEIRPHSFFYIHLSSPCYKDRRKFRGHPSLGSSDSSFENLHRAFPPYLTPLAFCLSPPNIRISLHFKSRPRLLRINFPSSFRPPHAALETDFSVGSRFKCIPPMGAPPDDSGYRCVSNVPGYQPVTPPRAEDGCGIGFFFLVQSPFRFPPSLKFFFSPNFHTNLRGFRRSPAICPTPVDFFPPEPFENSTDIETVLLPGSNFPEAHRTFFVNQDLRSLCHSFIRQLLTLHYFAPTSRPTTVAQTELS